jgi:hypothetical protein
MTPNLLYDNIQCYTGDVAAQVEGESYVNDLAKKERGVPEGMPR